MKLKELYKKEILPELKKELDIVNTMAVPRLVKASINVGFGRHTKEKDYIESIVNNLTMLSGQKPSLAKAKKAISAFKIRKDMEIGAKVTLRGQRMYDFVEKLVNVYFPRVRDFRGINETSVDHSGNLTVGFKEVVAFPEIDAQDTDDTHGLEISIATTAKNRKDGLALFKKLNFPFKKD